MCRLHECSLEIIQGQENDSVWVTGYVLKLYLLDVWVCTCGSQRTTWEIQFSFRHVGPGNWTRAICLFPSEAPHQPLHLILSDDFMMGCHHERGVRTVFISFSSFLPVLRLKHCILSKFSIPEQKVYPTFSWGRILLCSKVCPGINYVALVSPKLTNLLFLSLKCWGITMPPYFTWSDHFYQRMQNAELDWLSSNSLQLPLSVENCQQ